MQAYFTLAPDFFRFLCSPQVDKTKISSSFVRLAACDHRFGISVAVKGVRSTAQRTLEGSRNAFMLKECCAWFLKSPCIEDQAKILANKSPSY